MKYYIMNGIGMIMRTPIDYILAERFIRKNIKPLRIMKEKIRWN